jgi:hypothetical protein
VRKERISATGPEGFDVHCLRVVGHVGEHGRLEEEAACPRFATGKDAGALGFSILDQAGHRGQAALVGKRTHAGVGIKAVAELHAAVRSAKPLAKRS